MRALAARVVLLPSATGGLQVAWLLVFSEYSTTRGPNATSALRPAALSSGLKRPDRNAREAYRAEAVMSIQSSLSALHPGSSSCDPSPSTRSTKRTTFLAR